MCHSFFVRYETCQLCGSKSDTPLEADFNIKVAVKGVTWAVCVLQHAQAPEEAGLQRPALRQEEGMAGSQRDQRDRQRQLS